MFHRGFTSQIHRLRNIAFGEPMESSTYRVVLAAKQAQIAEYINSLEDGYSSIVGDVVFV